MNKKEARELLDKYLNGTATPEEKALFEQLSIRLTKARLENTGTENYDEIKAQIYKGLPQAPKRSFLRQYRFLAAAASIIICIFAAVFTYQYDKQEQAKKFVLTRADDVAPGGNRAVLTLANGKKIILTTAGDGQLADQTGTTIKKTHNGQLTYTLTARNNIMPAGYNTTETPKGGQYQVQLADGTKVWLNSSSSLTYPTHFKGKERLVELKGEAYFEVAHNKAMPFKVKTGKQLISVLGTHFNVNAYDDEPSLKTTLLEGKVRINTLNGTASTILKPGEQALLTGNKLKVTQGDPEQAVAWKNGYFRFRGEDIKSIMRKLGRWYNIDVQYATTVADEGYYGTISRFKNIRQVLAVLTETGSVHFKVEGRSVTVMK